MSASHYLRHLAIAYRHFHPVDEHREAPSLSSSENVKAELLRKLEFLEKRCELSVIEGNDVAALIEKIKVLKSRLDVLSHQSAAVV